MWNLLVALHVIIDLDKSESSYGIVAVTIEISKPIEDPVVSKRRVSPMARIRNKRVIAECKDVFHP